MNSATTSHWHATLGDDGLAPDELPAAAEVVVVGGGILGAMTTYWLARAGARPLLIEGALPAAGASGRNGGLLVAGTAEGYAGAVERLGRALARSIWGFAHRGVALTGELVRDEGIVCDWRSGPHLALALDEAQLAGFARSIALLSADGFPMQLLDRSGAQSEVSTTLGLEVVGGKLNFTAATVHSAQLVRGVLAAARRHGARLAWGAPVTAIEVVEDRPVLRTAHGAVRANAAVVALNAWAGELLPELAGLITPVRGQALVTAPLPPAIPRGFGASITPTGEYGQQTPAGQLVFGGCRAAAPGRDVGEREAVPSAPVQAALEAGLARLFPALARAPIERRWAGLMGFTPDYVPLAGASRELPSVWFAGGFSGHGMPFAAPLGRLLAEAATSGIAPAELALFRADRPSLAG